MTDWEVPDFHARRDAGEVFFNPCEIIEDASILDVSEVTNTHATFGLYNWYMGPLLKWYAVTELYVEPPVITEAMKRTVKLNALAGIDVPNHEFSESIAESKKTATYLKERYQTLNQGLKGVIKEMRGQPRRSFGTWDDVHRIPSAWLEARFALRPLLGDITSAILAYTERNVMRTPLRRISRAMEESVNRENSLSYAYYYQVRRDSIHTVIARAALTYEVLPPDSYLWQHLGIRAKDWVTIPWALTPYSFLIDRALDVTSAIKASVALLDPNVTILGGTYSEDDILSNEARFTGKILDAYASQLSANTSTALSRKRRHYVREPWVPTASDVVPPIRPSGLVDTWQNVADLSALAAGRFSQLRSLANSIYRG
jgi:hypothetical protein